MKEVYIFTTKRDPDFLVGPRKSWRYDEDKMKFERAGEEFLKQMREHFPKADYPYLALLTDLVVKTNTLCIIKPDSPRLGGQIGKLEHWSKEYNASTSKGLARMIHEDVSRPDSPWQHKKPASCVVNFIGDNSVLQEALQLLADKYGHEIRKVVLE